jgi:hypothetical protein
MDPRLEGGLQLGRGGRDGGGRDRIGRPGRCRTDGL